MENTGKVLFDDDTAPQWYIALGEAWIGPLTAADVYDKVLNQEITWAHYVSKGGGGEWKRICDTPTFQAAVPSQPASRIQVEIQKVSSSSSQSTSRPAAPPPPPKAPEPVREWFLYYNDSQFGPFSDEEIRRYLRVGKIHGRVHAWKEGMPGWQKLEKIGGFDDEIAESARARESRSASQVQQPQIPASPRISATAAQAAQASSSQSGPKSALRPKSSVPVQASVASAPSKPKAKVEQRKSPRRPLLARILFAQGEEVAVGVCRDVSVGGMQILTDRIPGAPGSHIKLNVSAAGERGPKPFVATGVIVRLLEDGRGFSFRFDRLPEESRQIIEEYIRSEE